MSRTPAVDRYGIVDAQPVRAGVHRVVDLVEKPAPDAAPSDLAIVGRYILTPDAFPALEATGAGSGGEIQLTDALRRLLKDRPIHAVEIDGIRHDAGTKAGYLKATLHFASKRPDLAATIDAVLESRRAGLKR